MCVEGEAGNILYVSFCKQIPLKDQNQHCFSSSLYTFLLPHSVCSQFITTEDINLGSQIYCSFFKLELPPRSCITSEIAVYLHVCPDH